MIIKKILPFIASFFILFSCTGNLDFSQIEDYRATPEYTGSLISFTLLPFYFFNQTTGNQKFKLIEKSSFGLSERGLLADALVKIDFNAEIINEFNNDFTIQLNFLDANNIPTYSFQDIIVSASDTNFDFFETVEVNNNPKIKNTVRFEAIVTINNPLTVLDPSDLSTEFKFKSSLKLYF
jgi:hypothetical protein